MKKILLIFTIFLCTFSTIKSQDYRYIPDSNFRVFLDSIGCPFDLSGDSLDISSTFVRSINHIDCPAHSINSIEGIEYFISLDSFFCNDNSISFIDSLPESIEYLDCSMNLIDSIINLPINLHTLECSRNRISKLGNLPSSLIILNCAANNIDSLPDLPNSLEELNCMWNFHENILPELPINLKSLICGGNYIRHLPVLPNNLSYLSCVGNPITTIDSLPTSLLNLECDNCDLNSLPHLPNSLLLLSCGNNNLNNLPNLPDSLQFLSCRTNNLDSLSNDSILPINLVQLYCSENRLKKLPLLQNNLRFLFCNTNQLSELPSLPNSLSILDCVDNDLTSLPELPSNLHRLNCSFNRDLTCLPYLPISLLTLIYDSTSINCIPNIINMSAYSPVFGTHPFCNPLLHSCPSFTSISGSTFIDINANCIIDASEGSVQNISLILQNDTIIIQQVSTLYNGIYAFDLLPVDTYNIHMDTIESPFYIPCIPSGYDTFVIDSGTVIFTDRNFALQCKPGFDIGTTGLIRTGQIRPATPASFDLHAGDMASLYGLHCTNIAGNISVAYSGPMHYTGVISGTLLPDSILPNRLVWNIPDFSLLNYNEAIKPNFFVDSSAMIGDLVCFTIEVTPSIGDRIPSNNTFSQCFDVRAAYDPNYKEASPSGSITSSQDWMYYTIHFQNLGNSYAENIYVWDTIDPTLNLNTIQVMGASHNQFMQVFNNNRSVLFNFQSIFLEDSATNEPASHGWVQYRIKPNAGLAEGVQIHNTASILFDLNAPVITNTVTNRICNTPSNITQSYTIAQGQSIRVGTHTYTTSGRYTDVLSNINGCDSLVTTTLQVISGIAYENPLRILMYPNPANHQVFIQLEGYASEPLSIVDMYGRSVFASETITNKYTIDTESWSNGTYVLQCGSKRGKLVINH